MTHGMRRFLEAVISLLFLAAFVAAAYNVFADNYAVTRLAEEAACAGKGPACRLDGMLMVRTPIAQSFDYLIGGKQVHIRCVREYVLVGEYACTAEGAGVPLGLGTGAASAASAARPAAPRAPAAASARPPSPATSASAPR